MKKYGILFLGIILLWSCKKDAEDIKEVVTYDDPIEVELLMQDKEILEKVYSKDYLYPEDFFYEKNLEGSTYYENTRSIRVSQTAWIELHTNDKKQAKEWSEISNKLSSEYRELVSERETEKYFEFKRINPEFSHDIVLSRVHKSSYFTPVLDWSSVNYYSSEPTKIETGIFRHRPITVTSAKHFIEYYWSSTSLGTGNKVLEAKAIELPNWFQYNIKSASVSSGDIGSCDKVDIWEYDFLVHKRTGEVYFVIKKLKDLKGKC